jgi:cytoskeletal protein CcmA (bactofilin family)
MSASRRVVPAMVWLMLVASAVHAQAREIREIGPEADICAEINALPPGAELVLRPGEYAGPCAIRAGGSAGAPTVIRAKTLSERPRIVYAGSTANALDIKADHVTIHGLAVGPTQRNVDGIRIFGRAGIVVEDCEFSGLGGVAVVANHTSNQGLVVRRNTIRDSEATAMYFGCHDGITCVATDLVIEGNYIQTVRAPDPEIGYGIQVKLNSTALVRDNVVLDSKGPGIMLYGAVDSGRASLVEGNVVMGSLRSSGIVIGGGPVVVRNNVAAGNALAGVGLEDYGRRRLLRGVVVAHNTLYRNEQAAVAVARNGLLDVAVVNNAVQAKPGGVALPEPQTGLRLTGNVVCGPVACFVDGENQDFSPAPGGPLAGVGAVRVEPWVPARDYFGIPRAVPPTVGAVERLGGPLRLTPRP